MAYTDVDPETFKRNQEAAAARRNYTSAEYWSPKVGTVASPGRNVVRLLPPHEKMEGDAFVVVKMHFFPSKELGKNGRPIPIAINCLSEYGEDCDGCTYVDKLFKEAKNEDDPEQQAVQIRAAKDQRAKVRAFCQLVDMEHPDKGVQRYAFATEVENKLRMCFHDDEGNFRNVSHPKTGRDIVFRMWKKPGTDFNDYDLKPKEQPSALRDMDWLDKIEDLTELRKKPTKADMLKAIAGERSTGALPQTSKTATAPKAETATAAPKAEPKAAPTAKVETPKAETPKAEAAAKPKRQPVSEDNGGDPWATGRAACVEASFTEFAEVTPAEVEKIRKPNCYTKEPDPTDSMCQGCRVLLPCLTAKLTAAAA